MDTANSCMLIVSTVYEQKFLCFCMLAGSDRTWWMKPWNLTQLIVHKI